MFFFNIAKIISNFFYMDPCLLIFPAAETERTPLIRSYVQGLPSLYTDSVSNFYSPLASPEGSLHQYEASATTNLYPSVSFDRDKVSILIVSQYNILVSKLSKTMCNFLQACLLNLDVL